MLISEESRAPQFSERGAGTQGARGGRRVVPVNPGDALRRTSLGGRFAIGSGWGGGLFQFEGVARGFVFAFDFLEQAGGDLHRSEERRVGKEWRSRWSPHH